MNLTVELNKIRSENKINLFDNYTNIKYNISIIVKK